MKEHNEKSSHLLWLIEECEKPMWV